MVRDEADGSRVHHRQSVFLSALLEVREAVSDSLSPTHGQSARSLRTFRLVHCRLAKLFAS
jgi:hypothetical protein